MSQIASRKQEAVRIGNLVVFACNTRETLRQRRQKLLAQRYHVYETAHFVIGQNEMHQSVVLHTLGQQEVNADLISFIENELSSFALFTSAKEYGATLFAVMASTFPAPRHQPTIWRQFCLNTLARLRILLSGPCDSATTTVTHIPAFAAIYRRVLELATEQTVLDVGSSFGFLPILMAEWNAGAHIVGCDKNPDIVRVATDVATFLERELVTFTLHDVLATDFPTVGRFDTVTAIHLLEHVTEQELPIAFAHLLQVMSRRLIIAVPYETAAHEAYGHYQVFTPEKLNTWGKWCLERLDGTERYWCEEVAGGMLIIERL